MQIEEIRKQTKKSGLDTRALDVPITALIRTIHKSDGKPTCFRTDKRWSCSEACEWAPDCKKLVAAWQR